MDMGLLPSILDTPDGAHIQFAYRAGEGPCVALAHPHSGDMRSFEAVLSHITAPVLIWDRRGYGASSRGQYTTPQEQDLIHLLDHLSLSAVVGIGVAAGGAVMAGMAARAPQRLLGLGLANSLMGASLSYWLTATQSGLPTGGVEQRELSDDFRASPAIHPWRAIQSQNQAQNAGEPPQPCGATLTALTDFAPLALATGTLDRLFTPAMLTHAQTVLPQAKSHLFDAVAHAAHVEDPRAFATWIKHLVSRV